MAKAAVVENELPDYELNLPVFKRGDDLGSCLEHAKGNSALAFQQQAEVYEEAARICRVMAGRCKEVPTLTIAHADTHYIAISGPKDVLDLLVKEEILDDTTYKWQEEERVLEEDFGDSDDDMTALEEELEEEVEPAPKVLPQRHR